jgi:hypothetical protein
MTQSGPPAAARQCKDTNNDDERLCLSIPPDFPFTRRPGARPQLTSTQWQGRAAAKPFLARQHRVASAASTLFPAALRVRGFYSDLLEPIITEQGKWPAQLAREHATLQFKKSEASLCVAERDNFGNYARRQTIIHFWR